MDYIRRIVLAEHASLAAVSIYDNINIRYIIMYTDEINVRMKRTN